jgi:hypothetical protein
MCLSRIVRSSGAEHLSLLRPRWITGIFLGGDLLALNVQGNGAGLAASDTPKVATAGQIVVIAGLIIQLVIFAFFIGVAAVWHRRMAKHVRRESAERDRLARETPHATAQLPPWRQGLTMLYACSALIGVRSTFRVVEYIQGNDGYLLSTEWPLYVFDAALMLLVQVIYVIWFPSKFKVESRGVGMKWMRLLDIIKK